MHNYRRMSGSAHRNLHNFMQQRWRVIAYDWNECVDHPLVVTVALPWIKAQINGFHFVPATDQLKRQHRHIVVVEQKLPSKKKQQTMTLQSCATSMIIQ